MLYWGFLIGMIWLRDSDREIEGKIAYEKFLQEGRLKYKINHLLKKVMRQKSRSTQFGVGW